MRLSYSYLLLSPLSCRSYNVISRPTQSRASQFSHTTTVKMPSKNKYSDPKLRDEVKEDIKQSDKGGEPGQWSARKAQMMAKEYKKRGGDYNTPKESKDESQKNLEKWGDEEWQTKEGSGNAKQDDGSMKRYLPKKAWEQMSEGEKEETEQKKKEEGGENGKQFVGNTSKAKDARKKATKGSRKETGTSERKTGKRKSGNSVRADDGDNDNDEGDGEQPQSDASQASSNKSPSPGHKRSRKPQDEGSEPQKKQKTTSSGGKKSETIGSKHDKADAPAQQGSKDRLPKKGQKSVHWKAMPGWVEGEVVEIVKSSRSVEGKQVKGSEKDPKVVLKSKSSGKICVHKADNVYFD